MRRFLVTCPAWGCEHEWAADGEIQETEPDVGIHGGVALDDLVCPECGHAFTEAEQEAAERRAYEWSMDDYDDYDV